VPVLGYHHHPSFHDGIEKERENWNQRLKVIGFHTPFVVAITCSAAT